MAEVRCQGCGVSGGVAEVCESGGRWLCRRCYLQKAEVTGADIRGKAPSPAAGCDSVQEGREECPWPATDTGNAEYLASLFGQQVRYDHRRKRWLQWRGHRWEPDRDGEISRLAVEAARRRYAGAQEIGDLRLRQRAAAWAIASESRAKIDACISLARDIRPIADDGENWDRGRWLLGAGNGVLDLKTGAMRPGRPEDRITMTTGVDFDANARCPRWEQFLAEVFGDADFVEWLQRALGYSITGDTSEQCVFIGYGVGGNGKGVFNGTLNHVLSDYAYTAPFSTFELYQRAGIPNDLAALESKRFVSSSETNDNTRLNEARIKAISGCDPVTARYLHQEYFTFQPHLKLWLFVNHKPRVVDDSFGFWRRVRLVPFTRQFTGKADDRQLGEKLRSEAPGILAWLVRGCLEWQRRGLDPVPGCVASATRDYQQESDPLSGFVAEHCVDSPGASVQAADIYRAYKEWAEGEGLSPREVLTATAFGRRMGDRYQKERRGGKVVYHGVVLTGQSGQSQDSLTLNITKSNVIPIQHPLREKNIENYPNYPAEHEICPDPGDNCTDPTPDYPGVGRHPQTAPAACQRAKAMWEEEL